MKLSVESRHSSVAIVHHVDDEGVLATRGRRVFRRTARHEAWRAVAAFPSGHRKDALSVGRLASRLLRSEKCNVHPTREGKLLGIRRGVVYALASDGSETRVLGRIHGESVMPRAIAEDREGRLYFGEYFGNPDRVPVRIWRVDPLLERLEVAFEFPAGKTRHIHAVHADPFVQDRLWVTMGDFAGECHLVYTDDSFETVHYLGAADQLWRMVGIIFREDRLCWLTDTHIEQNYVVSMDRSRCEAEIVGERDASSWYAAETSDGLYLATTTVEPGPGIHTDQVRLLASEDAREWEPVAEFAKDAWPMTGFGFGSIALPSGVFDRSEVWLSGEAVGGLDGRVLVGSVDD